MHKAVCCWSIITETAVALHAATVLDLLVDPGKLVGEGGKIRKGQQLGQGGRLIRSRKRVGLMAMVATKSKLPSQT